MAASFAAQMMASTGLRLTAKMPVLRDNRHLNKSGTASIFRTKLHPVPTGVHGTRLHS